MRDNFILLLLLIPYLVYPQERNYSITKIANAGVLITEGNQSILIDGIFEKVYDQFEVPGDSILKSILKKEGQFEPLEYALVTHGHGDHYSKDRVDELLTNQKVIAIMPSELNPDETLQNPSFSGSVIYVDAELYEPSNSILNSISITSFSLPHTGGFELQNICFLITLKNETRILHTGDGDLSQLNHPDLDWLWAKPVDLLIVPYFEIGNNLEVFKSLTIQSVLPVHFDLRIPNIQEKITETGYDRFVFFPESGILKY